MVSFRPTGSAQQLFGNYNIEVDWTESAELDLNAVADSLLVNGPTVRSSRNMRS
jgi:hypothetical protein